MTTSTTVPEKTVAEIMCREPVTIKGESTTSTAIVTMSTHGIRHLVVISTAGTIVGLVSQRDIFRSLAQWGDRNTPVQNLMSSPAIWIPEDMPVSKASQIMCKEKIGCLVVFSPSKQLVGVVTRSDLLSLLHESK